MDQFGLMRGKLGVTQIQEFLENENLTTIFSEIQQLDSLVLMFSKFLIQLGYLGGIKGHNPPKNWDLQHFQEVPSLNIGDIEQDTVGP